MVGASSEAHTNITTMAETKRLQVVLLFVSNHARCTLGSTSLSITTIARQMRTQELQPIAFIQV